MLILVGCESKEDIKESILSYEEQIEIALESNDQVEYERLRELLEKEVDKGCFGCNSVYYQFSYDNALKLYNNEVESEEEVKKEEKEVDLRNRYAGCTVETCSQEMLIQRYYEVKSTKDNYLGEDADIAQVLLDLYGVDVSKLLDLELLQEFIISNEELIADDNPFFDVKDYIDNIVQCVGQCESKFISYEEATSLAFDEALALVRKNSGSYEVGSSPIDYDTVTDSTSSTNSSSSTQGSQSSSSTTSSSASSSTTTKVERTPIATCKSSNPVDCAVRYIKDNYNVGFFTLSDDVQAYQNTTTKDYVIYVTIKGENTFGGTVQNTFEVTTDEDSKYVYSCIQK